MQTLTVDASTDEVAQGLQSALLEFRPEVRERPDGGYRISVSLRGGDAQIVGILSALQRHVTERADGPARVELAGRSYTLHAEPNNGHSPRQARHRIGPAS